MLLKSLFHAGDFCYHRMFGTSQFLGNNPLASLYHRCIAEHCNADINADGTGLVLHDFFDLIRRPGWVYGQLWR